MAVTDDRIYHPTDALILKKPRRHYRVGLHCEHWQLRSQIGISSAQHVYYVGGNGNTQVHRLDTAAHESEVVKLLTFVPRCLVARNGWVCCGGENGEFVGFQMNEEAGESIEGSERDRGNHLTTTTTADFVLSSLRRYIESGGVSDDALETFRSQTQRPIEDEVGDEQLPLALDTASDTADPLPPLVPGSPGADANNNSGSGNGKGLVARSKTFGKERVNCITLWFPPSSDADRARGAYAQSVAVLANNDKHVTIVGLTDQESVDELSYPDYVNRALISPDGRLLVAICDDPYLYIHERVPKQQQPTGQGLFTRKDVVNFEWKLCAKTHLKSQRKEDRSDQRGSFAACFSSTGRYLAVGTQYGVISVFETAAFTEGGCGDPLITTFQSSRPHEEFGAIRDMAFCPGPFDLLAWTEHRGHIGVADVRSNYVSRQILDLSEYNVYDHLMVTERGSIDPRLLERNERGELALADTGESAARRAATRRPPSDYHPPLNADETMILEALMEQRRRRDQAATRGTSAVGTRLIERLQNRVAATRESLAAMPPARNNSNSTSNSPSNGNNSNNNNNNNNNNRVSDLVEIYRESLREPQSERARARRHAEVHVAHAERATNIAATLRVLRTQVARAQQNLESYRADSPATTSSSTDLDNLYQSTFDVLGSAATYEPGAGDSSGERPRDYLASVWSTILRHRDHQEAADITISRLRAARMGDRAAGMNVGSYRPDDTAGLAWSDDGRTLIVGAEDGIYEFHVDLFSRKLFPSITMR